MRANSLLLIILGQLCFFAALAICILLKPEGLDANNGISYYGVFRETIIPYLIGLLGAAFFCWVAAGHIDDQALWPLKFAMVLYSLLTIGIVLTPDTLPIIGKIHILFGSLLFLLQVITSLWLTVQLHYKIWSLALLTLQLTSGIAAALYLRQDEGLLMQSQIVFQLAFGVLLILSMRQLYSKESSTG